MTIPTASQITSTWRRLEDANPGISTDALMMRTTVAACCHETEVIEALGLIQDAEEDVQTTFPPGPYQATNEAVRRNMGVRMVGEFESSDLVKEHNAKYD